MTGTILITGANGSLAIPAVEHLLSQFPAFTLVLTVRNTSDEDVNTKALRHVLAKHDAKARASIRKLDLASLKEVSAFASGLETEIAQGTLPPLASIVCNAFYWNLKGPFELTEDGYEKTMQVNHLAHASLVLRLLGSFGPDGGRVVLFVGDSIEPGKNKLEVIPASIPTSPDGLEHLVHPAPDDSAAGDSLAHGFCRYATSKLTILTWGLALIRRLEKDPKLSNITVFIWNPGNLSDSRAQLTNTPRKLVILSKLVVRPLSFVLRLMDPIARTSGAAGIDTARVAANAAHPGERGFFTLLKRDQAPAVSRDEQTQDAVWTRSAEWAGITQQDTALAL